MKDVIQLIELPENTPSEFLSDDVLYVDLNTESGLSITELLEELTDINKINFQGALDIDLPASPKNLWIFGEYIAAHSSQDVLAPIQIVCIGAGSYPFIFDLMYFKGYDENSSSITISLEYSQNIWYVGASNLLLSSLDWGEFSFNKTNIEGTWDNLLFEDGDAGYIVPTAHYGGSLRTQGQDGGFAIEELMFWFSVVDTLKKGYLALGWGVESPLFDLDWFNSLWAYIAEDAIDYDNKGFNWKIQADLTADSNYYPTRHYDANEYNSLKDYLTFTPYLPIPFDDFVFDLKNQLYRKENLSAPTFRLSRIQHTTFFSNASYIGSKYKFRILGEIRNESVSGGAGTFSNDAVFDIVCALKTSTGNVELGGFYNISLSDGEVKEIDLETEIEIKSGEEVAFYLTRVRNPNQDDPPLAADAFKLVLSDGFSVQLLPSSPRLYEGDLIQVNQTINEDYTFLDYVKGIAHLGALKIETELSTRTVYIFPTKNTQAYLTSLEGFYRPTSEALEDITEYVVQKSKKVQRKEEKTYRYYQLAFRKSTDKFIERQRIPETAPLFSHTIDLGAGIETETKVLENPFFEPTDNIIYNRISMPALWNNTDGKHSFNHRPRIVCGIGKFAQVDSVAATNPITFEFMFEIKSELPCMGQLPRFYYLDTTVKQPVVSVVYGGAGDGFESLFTQFWRSEFQTVTFSKIFEFLMFCPADLYSRLSFRNFVFLYYNGESILGRLTEKRDYRPAQELPIIIKIIPEPFKDFE